MLTALFKWIAGSVFLGSLFWCSTLDCVALLAVWTAAIGVLICSNLADRSLWIPALLALSGVLSSIVVFGIPDNITVVANLATLVLFIVSLQMLKKHHSSISFARLRTQ
jgi:hypothetical protein